MQKLTWLSLLKRCNLLYLYICKIICWFFTLNKCKYAFYSQMAQYRTVSNFIVSNLNMMLGSLLWKKFKFDQKIILDFAPRYNTNTTVNYYVVNVLSINDNSKHVIYNYLNSNTRIVETWNLIWNSRRTTWPNVEKGACT